MKEGILRQMLTDRGYTKPPDGDAVLPDRTVQHYHDAQGASVYVHLFPKDEVLGVKEVRAVGAFAEDTKSAHAIIVCCRGLNNYVTKIEMKQWDAVRLECFLFKDLQVNPTQSCYYCPHVRLDKDAAQAVLRRYAAADGANALPKIRADDAIVRYFGWVPGDVLAIEQDFGGYEGGVVYNQVIPV